MGGRRFGVILSEISDGQAQEKKKTSCGKEKFAFSFLTGFLFNYHHKSFVYWKLTMSRFGRSKNLGEAKAADAVAIGRSVSR